MEAFRAAERWENVPLPVQSRNQLLKEKIHITSTTICDLLRHPVVVPQSRIGSKSTEGEVYTVDLNVNKNAMMSAALKLMPVRSEDEIEKNKYEIQYAEAASNLVVKNKSQHFPLVFGSGYCEDVQFFKDSVFQYPSSQYTCLQNLMKDNPSQTKRIKQLSKTNVTVEDIACCLRLELQIVRSSQHRLII